MNNLKSTIIQHFDDQSSKKKDHSDIKQFGSSSNHPMLRSPYLYIEKLISFYKKENSNFLDYCCGTGLFSIFPLMNNYNLHGMDISNQSIKVAKMRSEYFSLEGKCNFKVMDAENLTYEDNKFDIIVSYNSLSYLDLEKSYSELSRVLKPNGILIIMDSVGHNLFFRINRNRNLSKWASNFINKVNILKIGDINLANKYFNLQQIKYFDFLSIIFLFLNKKFSFKLINWLDSMILRLPFSYLLAFKYVAVYKSRKSS